MYTPHAHPQNKPDEREAPCKQMGCKYAAGACAFDVEAAKKSNPDPTLVALVTKAAECAAITDPNACKGGCSLGFFCFELVC